MKECLSLRPGVGIISGNNNYFIRTPNGNYKLQCNKEKIEEIETAIDEIAKNKSVELTPIIKMLKVIVVAYKKENNNSKNYEKTLDFYFYPINSLGRLLNRDKLNASNEQRG